VRKIAPVSRTQVAETPTFRPNAEIYEALLAEYPMGEEAAAYLKLRGFSETTISHFRLGFLTDAESASRRLIKCFGRESVYRAGLLSNIGERAIFMLPSPGVLFPFIEGGRIAYIQSRLLPGAKGKRWMGPRGVAKPVYNAEVITKSQTVYICECATDVVSAHKLSLAAIGILGGSSRLPDNVLSALKGRTVYIVPDADDAGSRIAAKLRENLRSRGIRCITKPLSMGKDINEFLLLSRRRQ
jgi:DNA primase